MEKQEVKDKVDKIRMMNIMTEWDRTYEMKDEYINKYRVVIDTVALPDNPMTRYTADVISIWQDDIMSLYNIYSHTEVYYKDIVKISILDFDKGMMEVK